MLPWHPQVGWRVVLALTPQLHCVMKWPVLTLHPLSGQNSSNGVRRHHSIAPNVVTPLAETVLALHYCLDHQ